MEINAKCFTNYLWKIGKKKNKKQYLEYEYVLLERKNSYKSNNAYQDTYADNACQDTYEDKVSVNANNITSALEDDVIYFPCKDSENISELPS